jgi:hypothetical protein
MNLMTNEKILMEDDHKQITLTTHRIRQENKSWGHLMLISIMLEEVTSCEYRKKSRPIFLIIGILLGGFAVFIAGQGGEDAPSISGGLLLLGLVLIVFYFFTIKRGLFISSATAKIKLNTKGMKDENIKSFINKLEVAKNYRLLGLKSEPKSETLPLTAHLQ